MQEDFFNLFAKLRDDHTTHQMPAFMGITAFYNLYPYEHFTQQYTMDAHTTLYNDSNNIDFDVDGWHITEIDGVPALDALRAFADNTIGPLKDDCTRFNLAVSGYKTGCGWFVFRPMSDFSVPKKQNITYTLQNPTTQAKKKVTYTWIGINTKRTIAFANSEQSKKDETIYQKMMENFILHELYKPVRHSQLTNVLSTVSASMIRFDPTFESFLEPTQFHSSKTRRQFMDAS
ncbi:hypothetical protein THRCLA_02668 [Thraustotheca clavata]|uniref:Uncharacterized protein n=1 Tax=Thraustotheca clavata TaxID=74557 RepID=A0A1W0A4D8_9STRA|nr:hypothetical protein THRCLA_02668 [Thraustotheca clavata]